MTIPIISKPSRLLRRELAELKPTPARDIPAIGSHMAKKNFRETDFAAVGPVVVMVRVDVAPGLATGVTEPLEKLLASHEGSGDPEPVTLQLSVTAELNPLLVVSVTVEVLLPPADTEAGAVADSAKFGTDV